MKYIDIVRIVSKRVSTPCFYLAVISILITICSVIVAAQGNQESDVGNYGNPDLVVESIGWDPISPETRDDVTITVVCANRGDASTLKGFSIYLYVDDQLIATKFLKPLDAGSSEVTRPITWKVGNEISNGMHTFFVYVNQDKIGNKRYIEENDFSNNEISEVFYITKNLPDLKLTDISWRPVDIRNRDSVTFTVSYSNIGLLSTDKGTAIWLYIDNDLVKKTFIGILAPDETGSVEIPWTVGRDFKGGEHDIIAYVDRDINNNPYSNYIQEEDEQNNVISKVLLTSRNESFTDLTIAVKDTEGSKPIESAEIFIDEIYVGNTDFNGELTSKVTEGAKHTIEISSPSYLKKGKEVTVNYNSKPPVVSIYLEYGSVPVTLSVRSESGEPIKNAEVSINSDQIGYTDIDGDFSFEAKKIAKLV